MTWICIECLVFLGEKGTFKREELGCVLEWPFGKVSKCCTFFPLVLGKKIVFLKSYSGGKPQFPPTCWYRILIFALGKRQLVTLLPNQHLQCVVDGKPQEHHFFFFFSLTSAMFNF